MRILLIEDDAETARYVAQSLREEEHTVIVATDGRQGSIEAIADWDLLIVDRLLPELDGVTLVRRLRASGVETPVLFLTTLSGIDDRVTGLNAGGDDYLAKPFAFAELVARVNALGRRPRRTAVNTSLRVADLEIDLITRKVCRGGQAIELQHREFQILEYLMRYSGQIVTRTMLLENVWDLHFDPRTNVVETHISRLRAKISRGDRPDLIQTIRGAGYCLRDPA